MIRIILFILFLTINANAVDLTLAWEPSTGATGYKVRMSIDGGLRYDLERDTQSTETTYIWTNAPEDKLLMFKVAAYDATDVAFNNYAGCWYDHRLKTTVSGYPLIGVKDVNCLVVWDLVSNATNYYLYYSLNKGQTYSTIISTGNVNSFKWASTPTDKLVFIQGCSVINNSTICRHWSGAWYDKRYEKELGGHIYWREPH